MATILAVDDIEDNVFLLKIILESLGHHVIPAYSGKEALATVDKEPVDLILLDIMMPVMSGLEVAKRLKKNKKTRHIPIIMLTAKKSDVNDVVEGLNAGAEEYLVKPFKEPELVARVSSMLRMKSLYDQVAQAKATMEEELLLAQVMQASLLPAKFPYQDKVTFTSRYEAAAAVGGDFFDALDFGDGKVGMVVADVAGHGPSAALIVAMIKVMFFSSLHDEPSPAAITNKLNAQLLDLIPPDKFVTLFLGIYDTREKTLRYIRAGHPLPFLLKRNGAIEPLKAAGDIVGMFDEVTFEEKTLTLESGDRIIGYSDGIIEACSSNGQQYGMGRLAKLIVKLRDLDANCLLDSVIADVKSFSDSESLEDDVILLLMEVN